MNRGLVIGGHQSPQIRKVSQKISGVAEGDLLLAMKISVAPMLHKCTTELELLSIAMEMATATQRAEKKRALGLGGSLPRAPDLPSPFVSMRR